MDANKLLVGAIAVGLLACDPAEEMSSEVEQDCAGAKCDAFSDPVEFRMTFFATDEGVSTQIEGGTVLVHQYDDFSDGECSVIRARNDAECTVASFELSPDEPAATFALEPDEYLFSLVWQGEQIYKIVDDEARLWDATVNSRSGDTQWDVVQEFDGRYLLMPR